MLKSGPFRNFIGRIIDISSEYAPDKRLVAIGYHNNFGFQCTLWDNKFPHRLGCGLYTPADNVRWVASDWPKENPLTQNLA